MNLLDINVTVTPDSATTAAAAGLTMWELLAKGGWTMIPLLLLSILALYALLERIITLYIHGRVPQKWIESLKQKIKQGNTAEAAMLCVKERYAVARIAKAGIEQLSAPTTTIENAMKHSAQTEVYALEKNLWLLGTIAGAAPMLVFLGTVLGMIQAFMAMAQNTGQVSPKLLSGGIYEAMITTAAGLVVGIFAYVSYNFILIKVQQIAQRIENTANQLVEMLQQLPSAAPPRNQ